MNDTDKAAQSISDAMQLVKAREALRLLRAEVYGLELLCQGWRVGCIVGWIVTVVLTAVNVWKWL